MKQLSATVKGLITGSLMIVMSLGIYYYRGNFDNELSYTVYVVYLGGIIWTLLSFKKASAEASTFKNCFSQGFKCFIVVTLMMVIFTWFFLKLNPKFEAEMAQNYIAYLNKTGNYTAAEIDSKLAEARKNFVTMEIAKSIFGYLAIGTLITIITSFVICRSKKNQ